MFYLQRNLPAWERAVRAGASLGHGLLALRLFDAALCANMNCYTYPRVISEQRGRYDNQPTTQGRHGRSEQFARSWRIERSPQGEWRCARIGGPAEDAWPLHGGRATRQASGLLQRR